MSETIKLCQFQKYHCTMNFSIYNRQNLMFTDPFLAVFSSTFENYLFLFFRLVYLQLAIYLPLLMSVIRLLIGLFWLLTG